MGTLYDWAIVVGAGIQGVPPILRISQQYVTATAGLDLSLPQIGTFSHPYVQTGFSYSIDWGDYSMPDTGTTANGGGTDGSTAAIVSAGTPGDYTIGTIGGDHTYAQAGTYYAEVTVSDAEGNSDEQTMQVVVNGQGPTFPDDGSPLNVVQASTPTPPDDPGATNDPVPLDSGADGGNLAPDTNGASLLPADENQAGGLTAQSNSSPATPSGRSEGPVASPDGEQDVPTADPALLAAARQTLDLPASAP